MNQQLMQAVTLVMLSITFFVSPRSSVIFILHPFSCLVLVGVLLRRVSSD